MTTLESDKITVNKPDREIFAFLSDFNNFKMLMPEQVTNWESTAEECSFTISGMASLGMRIKEKVPYTSVIVESTDITPFDFILTCHIAGKQQESEVQLVLEADLNP